MNITITEALAEIKTVSKRIASKREFIMQYIIRMEGLKDPLEKDGGSAASIEKELQAVSDLEKRIIELRIGIQRANDTTDVTLEKVTKTISEWLIWRREVAPSRKSYLNRLKMGLSSTRGEAQRKGFNVFSQVNQNQADKPTDFIVNINEKKLAEEIEMMENILSQLDGQLSLMNATVTIQ